MPTTIAYTGELIVTSCWCGIRVAIPDDLYAHAKKDSTNSVYCPLGHIFVYRESDATKLRREKAELEARLQASRRTQDHLREVVAHEQARVRGYQGALGKAKKRAAKGVCPAPGCKRSFVDVAAHVATCHPDLAAGE